MQTLCQLASVCMDQEADASPLFTHGDTCQALCHALQQVMPHCVPVQATLGTRVPCCESAACQGAQRLAWRAACQGQAGPPRGSPAASQRRVFTRLPCPLPPQACGRITREEQAPDADVALHLIQALVKLAPREATWVAWRSPSTAACWLRA